MALPHVRRTLKALRLQRDRAHQGTSPALPARDHPIHHAAEARRRFLAVSRQARRSGDQRVPSVPDTLRFGRRLQAPGSRIQTMYYLVNLLETASLKTLVRLSLQRWAIEQQYAELKAELGLDHFEGRSYHGRHRHVA